jgi:hypothetical protein
MSGKRPRRKPGKGSNQPSRPHPIIPSAPAPLRRAAAAPRAARGVWRLVLFLAASVVAGIVFWRGRSSAPSPVARNPGAGASVSMHQGPLTFNRDIAPIVFDHCAGCHHAGQAAPFSLLSFADVQKRSKLIARVTQRRYMPPWLPEKGYGEFVGERRLTDDQIALIQSWVGEGSVEGDAADLPPAPRFSEGWRLGQPDFVMTMPQAYTLAAEGKDVYRNLVAPIPLPAGHYIKGVEFRPGNPRVIHHAFIDVDETRGSRKLAERENPPGFDGMELPGTAQMPAGQLLGWQPGKAPYFCAPGLSWLLRPNTDLVLQLHMHPSGKPEVVQPALGFYFTDQPPTNAPFRVGMKCFTLDIPPGAMDYAVEESYTLPVGVTILRVSPHAHYLAKEMQCYAILPGGEMSWMIRIKDWDFNWQGDYEYSRPRVLPAGARLVMHYTYDNSTNNIRNPSSPPKRVRFGLQTTDEMGEIWFQCLTQTPGDRERLARDYFYYLGRRTMEYDESRVRLDPSNAEAHTRLGHDLFVQGKAAEARSHFTAAVAAKPDFAKAHYELAVLNLGANDLSAAYRELMTVLRLDPGNSKAYGNLGYIYSITGKPGEARAAFEKALQLDPDDSTVRDSLARLPRGQP